MHFSCEPDFGCDNAGDCTLPNLGNMVEDTPKTSFEGMFSV